MKTTIHSSLFFLCVFASSLAAFADPAPQPAIPAALEAPADQSLALVLTARGVQIYECRAAAGQPGKFEWAFLAPEADLFDEQGRKVGRHFAGPTWELTAGGKVAGHAKAKADAPDGKGVPWLLVEATQASGGGIMGKVQSIQRIATVGGKPPAEPADQSRVGQQVRVDYTAIYRFYVPQP